MKSLDISDAAEICKRKQADQAIVFLIDQKTGKLAACSYGMTKALCADAKNKLETMWDALQDGDWEEPPFGNNQEIQGTLF